MSEQARNLLDNAKMAMKQKKFEIAVTFILQAQAIEPKNIKAVYLLKRCQAAMRGKRRGVSLLAPGLLLFRFWSSLTIFYDWVWRFLG